jgi:putative component of toxin-antitoxin plasmid stabilization module
MYLFCFNDCIPTNSSDADLFAAFAATLKEYNAVRSKFPEVVDGIITEIDANSLMLNNNYSLADAIRSLDPALKTIAFRSFTKYPIEKHFFIRDEDDLIVGNYIINVNNINYNAINAKIVAENGSFLFSLAVHSDLKKNQLEIQDGNGNITTVNNLFGEQPNTEYINGLIGASEHEKLGNFEKLISILGENEYSGRFKSGFERVAKEVQDSVIAHFETAIGRKGKSKFFADGNLIKDVSSEKEDIFELRIFEPVAYRVYFYEKNNKIYLASIEQKPPKKTQNNQIKNAGGIIKELLLISN